MADVINVMVDLETLGKHAGCSILSIGAVVFDATTGTLGQEFYVPVSRTSCRLEGLVEDASTIQWWSEQSEEARAVFNEDGLSLRDAMSRFGVWCAELGGDVAMWGNGADFDNAMLQTIYKTLDMKQPWEFWNNRCYRTLENEFRQVPFVRQGVYHNALADAKSQALHAIAIKQFIASNVAK